MPDGSNQAACDPGDVGCHSARITGVAGATLDAGIDVADESAVDLSAASTREQERLPRRGPCTNRRPGSPGRRRPDSLAT
jgi:hypothetical protein